MVSLWLFLEISRIIWKIGKPKVMFDAVRFHKFQFKIIQNLVLQLTIQINNINQFFVNMKSQNHKYKIIPKSNSPTSISLTIINDESCAYYHLQSLSLSKITVQTISIALKKQNKNISYSIQQKQTQLQFQVIVSLEYLPKISEKIVLPLLLAHQAREQALLAQIRQDIHDLNKQYEHCAKYRSPLIRELSGKSKQIFKQDVQKGYYLLQFSGVFIVEGLYNGLNQDYIENQYQSNYFITQNLDLQIKTTSSLNHDNLSNKYFSLIANKYEGMEYPFAIIYPLEIKQPSCLQINILNDSGHLIKIQSSLLSITRAVKLS